MKNEDSCKQNIRNKVRVSVPLYRTELLSKVDWTRWKMKEEKVMRYICYTTSDRISIRHRCVGTCMVWISKFQKIALSSKLLFVSQLGLPLNWYRNNSNYIFGVKTEFAIGTAWIWWRTVQIRSNTLTVPKMVPDQITKLGSRFSIKLMAKIEVRFVK